MRTTNARGGRRARLVAATAVLPLLLGVGCGSEQGSAGEAANGSGGAGGAADTGGTGEDGSGEDGSGEDGSGDGASTAAGPCPEDLTAARLTRSVDLGSADVDGDGAEDGVAIGTVPGGGGRCQVAVVVTVADGVSAAPVAGASTVTRYGVLDEPVFAPVDGAAGDEILTNTTWSPRGGGEVSMFSWVDGELVQVQQGDEAWTVFATIDDGGGTPKLFVCSDGGFTRVEAYFPGDSGARVTTYTLSDGVVEKRQAKSFPSTTFSLLADRFPDLPRAGLVMFPGCG